MTVATTAQPRTRRWTRDEYYRLAEQGYFRGQRVQLIDGEIIEMAPQGHPHSRSLMLAKAYLTEIFGARRVRSQLPLNVPGESDPEPDLAVTEHPIEYYTDHPTTAQLTVEIADSSISVDHRKAGLYARAGVPEYWILDIEKGLLEVFRRPIANPNQEFGFMYSEHLELDGTAMIAPLVSPDSKIEVKSLF
jgi:Uma2 family endonuclease